MNTQEINSFIENLEKNILLMRLTLGSFMMIAMMFQVNTRHTLKRIKKGCYFMPINY
jgi:hypothetical protein